MSLFAPLLDLTYIGMRTTMLVPRPVEASRFERLVVHLEF